MRTRLRLVVAALTALLIVSGLSACTSHVGSAAYVGKYRISEKSINSYLTAQAKSYVVTSSTGSETIVPKNYALQLLIQQRVFNQVLTDNGGAPTTAELTKARTALLANTTDAKVTQQFTSRGFTPSFESLVVTTFALNSVLQSRYTTTAAKTRVLAAVRAVANTVRVSPRYGVWDRANFTLGVAPNPSFLRLNTTKTAAA